jgi:hypothetical protein
LRLPGHGFDPAESLLDTFADALAFAVTGVARGTPIDRRASPVGVLRHVRAHVHRPELVDEALSIVSLTYNWVRLPKLMAVA